MKHLIPFLIAVLPGLFYPNGAQATFTSISVEGASRAVVTTTASTVTPTPGASAPAATINTVTIFAGLAGISSGQTCNTNSDGTCNNCTVTPGNNPAVCNPRRIVASSLLRIRYSSSIAGFGSLVVSNNATSTNTAIVTGSFLPANSIGELSILWSDLCGKSEVFTAPLSTCAFTSKTSVTLRLVVNTTFTSPPATSGTGTDVKDISLQMVPRVCPVAEKDDTGTLPATIRGACTTADPATAGIQSWKVVAGDSKVYLKDLSTLGGTLTEFGEGAGIRLYYTEVPLTSCTGTCKGEAETAVANIRNGSTQFFESSFNAISTNSPELTSDRFSSGLKNDTIYVFKLAMVDNAGNVSHFTPDAYFNATSLENNSNTTPTQAQGKGIHAAAPGEVVGIVDQSQCFVATAAYGSSWNTNVETLRKFRDRFLMTNALGRLFVRLYYKWGPHAADAIRDNESARLATRLILYPAVVFAAATNALGAWIFLPLLTLIAIAAVLWPRKQEKSV